MIRADRPTAIGEQTFFRVDGETGLVILLDQNTGGDTGGRSYYCFSVKTADLVSAYLSTKCRKKREDEMTGEQREYFRSCRNGMIRDLFQYLISYMDEGNGSALTAELKQIGIKIEKFVRRAGAPFFRERSAGNKEAKFKINTGKGL